MDSVIILSLSILLCLLAGCIEQDAPPGDPAQEPDERTFSVDGCLGRGHPNGPFFTAGCPVFLETIALHDSGPVDIRVPYNATGIMVRFSIGPAVGQAEVRIEIGNHDWLTRFDGPFALTSHGDTAPFNHTSQAWFHQYDGSACRATSLTISAGFVGTYTTLEASVYAFDPGFDVVQATENLTVQPSCNGYWEGTPDPPTPNPKVATTSERLFP